MRFTLFALTLMLAGCTGLATLRPFVSDSQAVVDAGLAGVWRNANGEATYVVEADGKALRIAYSEKKDETVKLTVRLWRAGDATFADVTAAEEEPFQMRLHSIMRIWRNGDTLKMAFLDTDWLKEKARATLKSERVDDHTVVTSPDEEIRAFVARYGTDDKAWRDSETLRRAPQASTVK
jgi:hypothetical protein